MNQMTYPRCLCIGPCRPNHISICIIPLNVHRYRIIHLFCRFIHYLVPTFTGNQLVPILCQKRPIHAWSYMSCYHGCLYEKCAASTERIYQNPVCLPGCKQNQRSSQSLLNRRFSSQLPVSPFVQRLPCGIQPYSHLIFVEKHSQGITATGLWNYFSPISRLHPLYHSFFHHRLNICRTEKLTFHRSFFQPTAPDISLCMPLFRRKHPLPDNHNEPVVLLPAYCAGRDNSIKQSSDL